ncbi:hypothetical protein [Amycolatopsis thermophila]|uniref:Secreted protein n=1 Tax=Amycolatopsis thermophila TaxID=206084 RepID=A0ABU0ER85_9PSEU|nr:hypothetical protein [Amycolatopsis thermophila]MDQ0377810.1 hypothetical protein [Amycolatopsis thermophila]
MTPRRTLRFLAYVSGPSLVPLPSAMITAPLRPLPATGHAVFGAQADHPPVVVDHRTAEADTPLVSLQPGAPIDGQPLHTAARRAEQRLKRRPGHPVVEIAPVRPRQAPLTSGLSGHDTVRRLVRAGQLDHVGGPAANSQPFLDLEAEHVSSAERLAESSPDSAFLLLTKAAQLIGSSLLARQGPRPALSAPEQVVGTAVAAQFSQIELLAAAREAAGKLALFH